MTKFTITRIWIAGLIASAAGLLIGGVGLGLMVAGFAVAAAGWATQLAAWIGALINTYQLEEKIWFFALLAGGLLGLSFGLIQFAAMVAYLVAGPDGMTLQQPQRPTASAGMPVPAGA